MKIAFAFMIGAFHAERLRLYHETTLPRWLAEGVAGLQVRDVDKAGCWPTCKRAWRALLRVAKLDASITHCLVLQDDFVPCEGFVQQLEAFVGRSPAMSPLCVFQPAALDAMEVRTLMAREQDFVIGEGMMSWGGSLVLPAPLIEPIVAVADSIDSYGDKDDLRMHVALVICKRPVINIGRSLIRHIGARWDSLVGCPSTDDETALKYREGWSWHLSNAVRSAL